MIYFPIPFGLNFSFANASGKSKSKGKSFSFLLVFWQLLDNLRANKRGNPEEACQRLSAYGPCFTTRGSFMSESVNHVHHSFTLGSPIESSRALQKRAFTQETKTDLSLFFAIFFFVWRDLLYLGFHAILILYQLTSDSCRTFILSWIQSSMSQLAIWIVPVNLGQLLRIPVFSLACSWLKEKMSGMNDQTYALPFWSLAIKQKKTKVRSQSKGQR